MKFALIRKKIKKAFLKIGVIPACPVVATLSEDSHRESFFVVLSTDACVQKDSRRVRHTQGGLAGMTFQVGIGWNHIS
jgi:hypothetical protein